MSDNLSSSPSPPAATSTPPTQRPEFEQIRAVAKGQREVLCLVLACLLCNLGSFIFPPLLILSLVFGLLAVFAIYRLTRALGSSAAASLLYSLFVLIPFLNLLILLVFVSRATGFLQARGIRVGLLGVSDKALTASSSGV